jgi:hypothetical protein
MAKRVCGKLGSALAFAATLHCSLIASFDDFTGAGESVSSGPDATGRDDASARDGSARDGTTVREPGTFGSDAGAGQDANTAPEGGATGAFCTSLQPMPAFCEDYDRGAIGSEWVPEIIGAGTIATDSTEAQSRPSARRFTVAAKPPGAPCEYIEETRASTLRYARSFRLQNVQRACLPFSRPSTRSHCPRPTAAGGAISTSQYRME